MLRSDSLECASKILVRVMTNGALDFFMPSFWQRAIVV